MIDLTTIKNADKEVYEAMNLELSRQRNNIELIASENFVSPAVMAAVGTHLTNKYAEGLPGQTLLRRLPVRRYRGKSRHRTLPNSCSGADHANVQPHSGAQANMAVYFALLEARRHDPGHEPGARRPPDARFSPVNISGKYYQYRALRRGPKRTERIDYDELEKLAIENKPKMIVAGASAYPRIIDFDRLREIADKVGAYLMVDMAHIAGLVAAGLHPSTRCRTPIS